MKKEDLKVEKLEETVEEGTEVNGNGCLNDCARPIWSGNSSSWQSGCSKKDHYDAHWSVKR